MLAVGCRMLRLDATTLKDMTLGEINTCLSVYGNGTAIEDAYEDLGDCMGVKNL